MKPIMLSSALAVCLLSLGCGQPSAPGTPSPAATAAATAAPTPADQPSAAETPTESAQAVPGEGKEAAEKLLGALKDGRIPYQDLGKQENGPAFLYLLETSDDDGIKEDALKGLSKTYSGNERYAKNKNLTNERYDTVVLKYLDSENKRLLAYALEAAGTLLAAPEPNPAVVDKVVAIATGHKEMAARQKAVDLLYKVDKRAEDEAVMGAFLKALSDEPAVASIALFRLDSTSPSPVNKTDLQAKLEELLKHEDPGVRGRALLVVERYTDRDQKAGLVDKMAPFLKDAHAFVRSCAVKALASSRNTKAVATVMTVIDDKEKNTYDIRFEGLLGNDSVHHDGSAWSRVDDAVLTALDAMTGSLGDNRFKKERIDSKKVDEDIAAEVKRAKEWFEANKASL